MCVSEKALNFAAGTFPNWTDVVFVKCVPLMVTVVPPVGGPAVGHKEVTTAGATNVNWSAGEVGLAPAGLVTVTSTVPAASGGVVAAIDASEITVYEAAASDPKCTALAELKPLPEIDTLVPPEVDPPSGDNAVTVGAFWM